jgi:uncharacterized membrane protein (UPF0127 family)
MIHRTMIARIATLCLAAWLPWAALAVDQPDVEPLANFPTSQLQIASGGALHKFRIWIADTPMRRSQGLMFVRELEPDRGMLFVSYPARFVYFWMQNTYVSLDLLFIAPDGRIVGMIESAAPLSTDRMESPEPVAGVLEVPGGTSHRLGIKVGDRVLHPAFGRTASP